MLNVRDVSAPRMVEPGRFYLVTRRCANGQFLLLPSVVTNLIFMYCLIEAALMYRIQVIVAYAASNHHHTVIYDPTGTLPDFMARFHRLVAVVLNRRWGRCENLWSSQAVCVTELLDRQAVVDAVVYSAANPVKDGLVAMAIDWPGVNTYTNLLDGTALRARRPEYFFKRGSAMPEEVELAQSIPEELGPPEAFIADVKAGVKAIEARMRGRRFLGRKAILAQSWHHTPASPPSRSDIRPRFKGRRDLLIRAIVKYREFCRARRAAWEAYCLGLACAFPAGTYQINRRLAPHPTLIGSAS